MNRPALEDVLRYALALFASILALLLWEVAGKHLGATPYLFSLAAVMVASWLGGLGPGLAATALSAVLNVYVYIAPVNTLTVTDGRSALLLVLFVALAIAISWLNELRRRHEYNLIAAARQMERVLTEERVAREAAQAAEARALFLSGASDLLSGSLDYEATLQSLARLAVPQIADWCAVHIVDPSGEVRQIAVTHTDPAKVELARELEKRYPYDPAGPVGVPQVLRTGKSELISEIPEELLEQATPDAELLPILRELGLKSSMVVPLIARGRNLGAITFVAAESGRRFGPSDLMLAEELADRAALAVDNAHLYREAQRVGAERETILRSMADGVAIVDTMGTLTFANKAAQQFLSTYTPGISLRSILDSTEVRTLEGEPYHLDDLPLVRALRDRTTVENAYWRMDRADGSEMVVQGNAAPVIDVDGELLGAVSAFRDVTAQWNLERQKEDFLSSAAHDLKTPLASIKGLAQITLRRVHRLETPVDAPIVRGLQQIDAAATRMTGQINELLDAGRAQLDGPMPLNLERTDLVALARNLVAQQQQIVDDRDIRFQSCVEHVEGNWDAERLERALGNVLSNAVKYSPAGGDVLVRVNVDESGGDPVAVIAVQDRGIGIPAAELPRITERFYRARNVDGKIPGTGIGLAGVKQIMEQHGGTLDIESVEGEGTTVTMKLPVRGALLQ